MTNQIIVTSRLKSYLSNYSFQSYINYLNIQHDEKMKFEYCLFLRPKLILLSIFPTVFKYYLVVNEVGEMKAIRFFNPIIILIYSVLNVGLIIMSFLFEMSSSFFSYTTVLSIVNVLLFFLLKLYGYWSLKKIISEIIYAVTLNEINDLKELLKTTKQEE